MTPGDRLRISSILYLNYFEGSMKHFERSDSSTAIFESYIAYFWVWMSHFPDDLLIQKRCC